MALGAGSIAFTGFNGDGQDDLAFVALEEIPAGTVIYFTDNEWSGTGWVDLAENGFAWTASTAVSAGTVVTLSGLNPVAPATTPTANIGTAAFISALGSNPGLGNSNETIYAYLADPATPLVPTAFLSAISNSGAIAANGTLLNTGLTYGVNAIDLGVADLDADIGAFTGARTGAADFAAYRAAINTASNWTVQDASGDQSIDTITPDVPFSTTAFVAGPVTTETQAVGFSSLSISRIEQDAGEASTFTFAVARTGGTTGELSFSGVIGGTVDAADFGGTAPTTFAGAIPAGAASATVTVTMSGDVTIEANETVALTLTTVANSSADITVTINAAAATATGTLLNDDADASIGGVTVYEAAASLAGDATPPAASADFALVRLGSIAGVPAGSEVVAFENGIAFNMNNVARTINKFAVSAEGALSDVGTIDLSLLPDFGAGNSVAVKNGLLAFAYNSVTNGAAGHVALFDVASGNLIKVVDVGVGPDQITFTPDGLKLLTADEGERLLATDNFPGTISIIDLSSGAANAVVSNTIGFSSLNGEEQALINRGMALVAGQSASNEIEPEYIAVSPDGTRAYVTLQEVNAVAVLDLTNPAADRPLAIQPLGAIDRSLVGNAFDGNDQNGISLANFDVASLPQPDAIASFAVGGVTYFVTANEGDARVGLIDEARMSSGAYVLDPTAYPDAAAIKTAIGRLNVITTAGDADGDGDIDQITTFGGRGISIFRQNADGTIEKVRETGGEFEAIIARDFPALFNTENLASVDTRSDNRGPEPEGVTVGQVGDRLYAFVNLERVGGVMVYDVTDPANASFVTYKPPVAGDFAPEVTKFVGAGESPTGGALVLTANEASNTVTLYSVVAQTEGNDVLVGGAADDLFNGKGGDDVINGNGGNDTATYAATWLQANVTATTVSSAVDGSDILSNVETLSFAGATVSLADAINDAPLGADDVVSGFVEGDVGIASGNVLTNDTDADLALGLGETLAVTGVRAENVAGAALVAVAGATVVQGAYGTLTINADGSYGYALDAARGNLAAGVVGVDTFTYQVADAHGLVDLAQIQVSVTGTGEAAMMLGVEPNVRLVSILTVGEAADVKPDGTPWRMVGIPDGLGAYDNGDGTISVIMNHELQAGSGVVREHGAKGAFQSLLTIDKATLEVVAAEDAIKELYLYDDATGTYTLSTYAIARLCSGNLAETSAFYDAATGLGTTDRIFLTGEETGPEGKAFATVLTGTDAGKAYELAYMGLFSWENAVAADAPSAKTVVVGTDDGLNGQLYVYVGDKRATGNAVEKAGLVGGSLYGIKVTGIADETNAAPVAGSFSLVAVGNNGDAHASTGAALDAQSEALGVTSFLRPEDAAFDPTNPNVMYFTTTNSFNAPSRVYKMTFTDVTQPELGGTIVAVLDGTEGQRMLDNMTVNAEGKLILQEDVGNNAHVGRVLEYDPVTDTLTVIATHDPALHTPGSPTFLTSDEESSGVTDVTAMLGDADTKAYLLDAQIHQAIANAELVENGQLLAMYVDTPVLIGDAGNNDLFGSQANETFEGKAGDDSIRGGSGTDTAIYAASWTQSTVTMTTVSSALDGSDTISSIETLTFAGVSVTASAAINDAPIGADDAVGGLIEDGNASVAGNVLGNDTDADLLLGLGETLAVTGIRAGAENAGGNFTEVAGSVVVQGIYGDLTIHADGSYSYALANDREATNALNAGDVVADTFTYQVADAHGLLDTASLSVSITGATDATGYRLQLLHFSDAEAGLLASTTAPNLAALVDAFEDDYANSVTIASGDLFLPGPFLAGSTDPSLSGLVVGNSNPGRVDISIMNAIGIQLSTIGNHEFDLGSNVFGAAIAPGGGYAGALFPYLSANLDFSGDGALAGRFTNTVGVNGLENAATLNGRIAPSTVLVEGGETIGFVGATTQVLEAISSPSGTEVKGFPTGAGANGEVNDMDLLAAQLQPVIDDLIAQGVNKIVLVSHLQQLDLERLLATKLVGVDVIVAGGSHTRLGDANDVAVALPGHAADFADTYPIVTTGADGKTTLIVNTDGEYSYLGRLVVDFDANGDVVTEAVAANSTVSGAYAATTANVAAAWGVTEAELATTAFAEGTRGETVDDLTSAVQAVIDAKDGNVFGYASVYLEGERVQVRNQETNLGNVSADANGDAARDALGLTADHVVVSIKNGGGIRAQIGTIVNNPDGTVTKVAGDGRVSQLDVENALRFDNKLMVFDTTAQGLLNILNSPNALAPNNGGFIQIGGVRFSYDPTKPAGSRVQDVVLVNEYGEITAVVADNGVVNPKAPAKITAVALNFTANGGDGYQVKANAENFRYLLKDGTLSAPVDEALDFTAAANVPANALGEIQAFQDYFQERYGTAETAYAEADTAQALDTRIQNQAVRTDTVLEGSYVTLGTAGRDMLNGDAGANTLKGLAGNDILNGGHGDDVLMGGLGGDLLNGGAGVDTVSYAQAGGSVSASLRANRGSFGEAVGDRFVKVENLTGSSYGDVLSGDRAANVIKGGAGNDIIEGEGGADRLFGEGGDDTFVLECNARPALIDGGQGIDTIRAGADNTVINWTAAFTGIEVVSGDGYDRVTIAGGAMTGDLIDLGGMTLAGISAIDGKGGNDTILGSLSADRIVGGTGRDTLTGGAGADMFVFGKTLETGKTQASADVITDFSAAEGDLIDLSGIDAISTGRGSNDAFSFIGTEAFTRVAGQLRYETAGDDLFVSGDTNGDGRADFLIQLNAINSLNASDFLL